jgi:hypothetical protein
VPAKQVSRRDDKQPEPQYEHEYRKRVSDEIAERETALKQHRRSPPLVIEAILDQCERDSKAQRFGGRNGRTMSSYSSARGEGKKAREPLLISRA